MIEDVEELRAEFQPRALRQRNRLAETEIELPGARSAEEVTRRGAEFPSRSRKCSGIDPLRDGLASWRSKRNARNQIGTLRAGGPIRRRVIAGHQHIHREAGASQ